MTKTTVVTDRGIPIKGERRPKTDKPNWTSLSVDERRKTDIDELMSQSFYLTSRQIQILQLVAHGERYKEIANKLGLKESSIKNHVRRAREYSKTLSTPNLIYWALKLGRIS